MLAGEESVNSVVPDAETLPRELIPIAWASSTGTLPYLGNQNSDVTVDANKSRLNQQTSDRSVLKDFRNGYSWLSGDAEKMPSKEVLMGIKHCTWPHYGLQFHRESVATSHGRQIFKNLRKITEDYWGSLSSTSVSKRKVYCNGLCLIEEVWCCIMGCFCSCFRAPDEEEIYDVVVSNNHDVSNKQNCAPLSYVTQFFKNKYGVVSSNSGLQTLPASAQGTYIAITEVGINTPPRDILLENSSRSGNLELQGSVAVAGNGVSLGPLQLEWPEGHKVQVKGADITTTEVGSNAPQGTLLQNSSSSRNLELQGHVPVQENGTGSDPLQLEHGLPEGHNVHVNLSSKSEDNMKLRRKSKDNRSFVG